MPIEQDTKKNYRILTAIGVLGLKLQKLKDKAVSKYPEWSLNLKKLVMKNRIGEEYLHLE